MLATFDSCAGRIRTFCSTVDRRAGGGGLGLGRPRKSTLRCACKRAPIDGRVRRCTRNTGRPRPSPPPPALRAASASTGAILVDLARHPVGSDPRLWSVDRLHANSEGHERIAAALAHGLGLPNTDDGWSKPFPTPWSQSLLARISAELRWQRDYFLPWVWRHLWGRSSGDGRGPKRPALLPMTIDSSSRGPFD